MKEEIKKYKIGTTIQRQDGTFDYCVEKLVDLIPGLPGYQEIFKGTKEECESYLKEIETAKKD